MRGVGDELALGAQRRLQRAEQLVQPGREAADLIPSAMADPLAQITGLDDPLGRLGEPSQWRDRCARDERTEQRGNGDPAQADDRQDQPPDGGVCFPRR